MDEHVELLARFARGTAEQQALLIVDLAVGLLVGGEPLVPSVGDAIAVALELEGVLALVTGGAGVWGLTGDEAKAAALHELIEMAAGSVEAGAGAEVAVARSCEQRGDIVGMERHLRAALRIDAGHPIAHAD